MQCFSNVFNASLTLEELGAPKLAVNSAHLLITDEPPAGMDERLMPIIRKGFLNGTIRVKNFLPIY